MITLVLASTRKTSVIGITFLLLSVRLFGPRTLTLHFVMTTIPGNTAMKTVDVRHTETVPHTALDQPGHLSKVDRQWTDAPPYHMTPDQSSVRSQWTWKTTNTSSDARCRTEELANRHTTACLIPFHLRLTELLQMSSREIDSSLRSRGGIMMNR